MDCGVNGWAQVTHFGLASAQVQHFTDVNQKLLGGSVRKKGPPTVSQLVQTVFVRQVMQCGMNSEHKAQFITPGRASGSSRVVLLAHVKHCVLERHDVHADGQLTQAFDSRYTEVELHSRHSSPAMLHLRQSVRF